MLLGVHRSLDRRAIFSEYQILLAPTCFLRKCRLTKRSVKSKWVRAEVSWALENGKKVIPVKCDDCNTWECNLLLQNRQHVEFREPRDASKKKVLLRAIRQDRDEEHVVDVKPSTAQILHRSLRSSAQDTSDALCPFG